MADYKMQMSIFDNDDLHWKQGIPKRTRSFGLLFSEPKRQVKECIIIKTASIIPEQLPVLDTKYFCMIKALNTVIEHLIRGDVLNIHSNFSRFQGDVGGKYDIRLEDVYKRITDRNVTINKSLMEIDNTSIEIAYDSIVVYFHKRGYQNIPCIRCDGLLVKRFSWVTRKSFLGCSEYPQCRKIVSIEKQKKPRKR